PIMKSCCLFNTGTPARGSMSSCPPPHDSERSLPVHQPHSGENQRDAGSLSEADAITEHDSRKNKGGHRNEVHEDPRARWPSTLDAVKPGLLSDGCCEYDQIRQRQPTRQRNCSNPGDDRFPIKPE